MRYTVRCIYRQAGTPLADDQDQSLVPDRTGVKELVDRYASPGPGPQPPVLSGPLGGRPQARGGGTRAGSRLRFRSCWALVTCGLKVNGRVPGVP